MADATGKVYQELDVEFQVIKDGYLRSNVYTNRVELIEDYSTLADVPNILKISSGADDIKLRNIKFL